MYVNYFFKLMAAIGYLFFRSMGHPWPTPSLVPGVSLRVSPHPYCMRRSTHCDEPYSLSPLQCSISYAISVLQSVRPATVAPQRTRNGRR